MRVLMIVQRPQRRGAEIFAYQQSEAMRSQGHTVQTAYLYPFRADKTLDLKPGDYALDGDETHWQEKVPGVNWSLLQKLRIVITAFQPDVVQVNGARTIKYGAFSRMLDSRASWILIYRNIDNPEYWVKSKYHLNFYKRLVMPKLDGIVGVSQATLQGVRRLYNTTAPARFIPNGIDTAHLSATATKAELRQKLAMSINGHVILFMGNLTSQKRPDRFLRIIHKLHKRVPNLQGWLLGDGPQRSQLEQQVVSLGLEAVVHFWGYQEEIAPYLAAADLLLVTSDSDGIPAVVLEAGYMKLPVVAANTGGIEECIQDGVTGFLVDPLDEERFATVALSLLMDPEHCRVIGAQANDWIRQNFIIDRIAREYLEFYSEVINLKNQQVSAKTRR